MFWNFLTEYAGDYQPFDGFSVILNFMTLNEPEILNSYFTLNSCYPLCEISPCVALPCLLNRVGVHWGVADCPSVQRPFAAPDCTPWLTLTVYQLLRAVTHVGVLAVIFTRYVYYYHQATLAVNNDDGSNWEWLRDYLSALICDLTGSFY